MGQVGFESLQALAGAKFGTLLDPAAIGNHDRQHRAAVLGPPPAWHPVAAPLLFGGAVREERHQRLTGQGHVCILQFGKAEIAALQDAAGGVGIHVAAQGRIHGAVGPLPVTVEIGHKR